MSNHVEREEVREVEQRLRELLDRARNARQYHLEANIDLALSKLKSARRFIEEGDG